MSIDYLVNAIVEKASAKERFLVAIAGPPGAGKSTLAEQLGQKFKASQISHSIVPMDGFHLDNTLLELDGTRDRKGSSFTFDALGFVHLIKRLVAHDEEVIVPVFDRKQDQAIAGIQRVALSDRIVLVEGNYLLIDELPWSTLRELWDITVFVDPGLPVLEQRLIQRWIHHDHDPDSARQRAMHNDIPNARYVVDHSMTADVNLTTTDW